MIQFAPAISLFHSHLLHYVQSYLQRVFLFFFFFFNANFHWLVLFKPTQLLQEKGTYRKNQNNLTVLVIRLSGFCTFSYLIHQVLCTVKYKDTVTSKGQIVLFHNDRHIGGMKDPLHLVLSLLAIDEVQARHQTFTCLELSEMTD